MKACAASHAANAEHLRIEARHDGRRRVGRRVEAERHSGIDVEPGVGHGGPLLQERRPFAVELHHHLDLTVVNEAFTEVSVITPSAVSPAARPFTGAAPPR